MKAYCFPQYQQAFHLKKNQIKLVLRSLIAQSYDTMRYIRTSSENVYDALCLSSAV